MLMSFQVGTVKSVSAEAIRILLWVLGFMSFGYGTKEFEVTSDRLGCYRPEEHIDNPKVGRLVSSPRATTERTRTTPIMPMLGSTTVVFEAPWTRNEN